MSSMPLEELQPQNAKFVPMPTIRPSRPLDTNKIIDAFSRLPSCEFHDLRPHQYGHLDDVINVEECNSSEMCD